MPTTVAIIGAGPLGRWLALAAARAGYRVLLEDVMPQNLHHAEELLRRECIPPLPQDCKTRVLRLATLAQDESRKDGAPGFSGVAFVSTIEDAVREADLVIDCVPDELESKLEILWLLDRMAPPRTVLATPTTRLSIADLANCTYRPAQCIAIAAEAKALTGKIGEGAGAEILLRATSVTSAETVALVSGFWERLGFAPRVETEIS
ncbi:MAG: 3-hydroxyacyl-CoA dehydrogenase NAD-binding domain-containing protein [Terracidiphilus sp.]